MGNQLSDAYNEVSETRLKEIRAEVDVLFPDGFSSLTKKEDKKAVAFYESLETLGEEIAMKKNILQKMFPTQKERLTGLLAIADAYPPRDQYEVCMGFLEYLPKDAMTRNGLLRRSLDVTRYTGEDQEDAVQWVYDEAEEGSALKAEAAVYLEGLKDENSNPDKTYIIQNTHPFDF